MGGSSALNLIHNTVNVQTVVVATLSGVVRCGIGRDVLRADRGDTIGKDCEMVKWMVKWKRIFDRSYTAWMLPTNTTISTTI